MTTAAKPTFFPAVGGEDQGYFRMEGGTRQVSVKDLPGHTKLKLRKQVSAFQEPKNFKFFETLNRLLLSVVLFD